MTVGDITSPDKGTGARFNDGKARLEYIPARVLHSVWTNCVLHEDDDDALAVLGLIAHFEEYRDWAMIEESLTLISFHGICEVFHYGAQKYAAWNWAKGMAWSVPMACIKRHIEAVVLDGEAIDAESGLPHMAHVGCNLVMLLHYRTTFPEGDDLPPVEYMTPAGYKLASAELDPLEEYPRYPDTNFLEDES